MFPHMYKVRPGKSQQVKSSTMSADCDKWQADSWRRNSQKWGSQGWEGGPPSPASSIPQTPPPIPAPPPDPQDNLTKELTTDSSIAIANEDSCNNTATEKETKYWWEMNDDDEAEAEERIREEEEKGEIVTDYWNSNEDQEDSAPLWCRSRSRTSSPPKRELDAPPTGRRRSRNVMRDLNCPTEDTSRMSTSPPVRRRSRPTTDEPQSFSERSSSASGRRRRRNDENEVPNGPSQSQESNRSTSPPIRRRTRERSSENDVANQNSFNEGNSHPIRRRSRSRTLQTNENTDTPENIQVNSTSPVMRRRARPTNQQQDNDESEGQHQNSFSPPLRVRVRNPSADTNSASANVVVEEVVLSLPPRRRRPPVLVEGERKSLEGEPQKQSTEPQMAVEMFKEIIQERSHEPEVCRSTLQVELKTPLNNAQRNCQVLSSDISRNNEPAQVEDSNEVAAATDVLRMRRPVNATNEDQPIVNLEEKSTDDRSRKRSGSSSKIQDQKLKDAEEQDEQPHTTVIVRKRPISSHSATDDKMINLSEERNDSAYSSGERSDTKSENEEDNSKELADQEPAAATTVKILSRPILVDTEDVELSPSIVIVNSDINSVEVNKEPPQDNGYEEVSPENDPNHRKSVTLSTGSVDNEINECNSVTNRSRHSDSLSFSDGRDENTTESIVSSRPRRLENEIIVSDDVVEYVNEKNNNLKDEEVDWTTDQQNIGESNMDAEGWLNCDMEAEIEDHVLLQQNPEQEEATEGMEVEKDEEDEVAKATRIWLESQQALLSRPKPMKIIYLTEEELKFDPLQQVKEEEEKVHMNSDYDWWDAEPADQEPTPEFLKKKLNKVEAQASLTPLKIDRERSPVSPVLSRRRDVRS